MRSCFAAITLTIFAFASAPADAAGAAYHHIHLTAPNPEEAAQWYISHMGCEAMASRQDAAQCGTVQLLFYQRPPMGGTVGTGMHHIGFSYLNLDEKMQAFEAAGVKIVRPVRPGGRLKAAFVEDPWGTRIEVVEDPGSLGLYHVHLHTADPLAVLKWYQNAFGGELRKRELSGVDGLLYGKFWVLATRPAAEELPLQPTDGRAVDHLGFSVANVEATAADLKAKGVTIRDEVRTVQNPVGETLKIVFLVAPDDVLVELVQPPSQ